MTDGLRGLRIAGFVLLLALLSGPTLAQPRFPPLTGRVVDAAGVLPSATEAQLTARLAQLESATGRQLVVATVPALGGYEIEEYGNQLFRAWRLGDRARNDGALLLVAPTEKRVRVEVGYGLEGVLTDGFSGQVIRRQFTPRAAAGDLAGGVVAATEALSAQLTADPEAARRNVAAATRRAGGGGSSVMPLIFTVLTIWVLFSLIGGLFGRGRRRRRGGGAADWIVPAIVFGSGLGRGGGGGFGGGGFGGGGFSGGGGSSGGGGASGGW